MIPESELRERWLLSRNGRITATRCSAILYPTKWGSPATVYGELVLNIPHDDIDPMLSARGEMVENWFNMKAARRFPFLDFYRPCDLFSELEPTGGLFIDPVNSWKAASVDWIATMPGGPTPFHREDFADDPLALSIWDLLDPAKSDATKFVLFEIKAPTINTPHKKPDWDEQIPKGYAVQGCWEKGRTGAEAVIFAVLFADSPDFAYYPLEYDPDVAAAIDGKIEAWYNAHIVPGVPPELVGDPNADELLQAFFGEKKSDQVKVASPELSAKLLRYLEINGTVKPLLEEKDGISVEVKAEIGSDAGIVGDGVKATLGAAPDRIDNKAVINELITLVVKLTGVINSDCTEEEAREHIKEYPTPEEIISRNTSKGTRVLRVTKTKGQ